MAPSRLAGRGLLAAALVVLVALVAGVLIVRRALDPERLRPLAEQQLSALLHVPVRVGHLELHFRPVPSLDGLDIDIGGQSANRPPSLRLDRVHLVPRLSTLLSPTIVLETAELEGLHLNVLREADGRWAMPGPTHLVVGSGAPATTSPGPSRNPQDTERPGAAADGTPAGTPGTSLAIDSFALAGGTLAVFDDERGAPAATIDRISAVLHGDPRRLVLDRISGSVGSSTLTGSGSFGTGGVRFSLVWEDLKPADMPRLLALAGLPARDGLVIEGKRPLTLELESTRGSLAVRGTLAASRIALPPLTLTGLASPFTYTAGDALLQPLTFSAYQGSFSGRLAASPAATPRTWRLAGSMQHLDLGALVAATTSLGDKLSGSGTLRVDVRGRGDLPVARGTSGGVTLAIADGVIRDFPLLAAVNRSLEISGGEGNDTRFDRVDGSFTLGGGQATTRDLRLVAGALTVALGGTLGLDDQVLDLTGTARFTREKTQELMKISKHVGGAKNDNGEVELPLTIRGTMAAPDFRVELGQVLMKAAKKELERGLKRELNKLFKP